MIVATGLTLATSAEFTYRLEEGGVTITGGGPTNGQVLIPASLEGLPVRRIADGAFRLGRGVTNIVVPDSVRSIGNEAFRNQFALLSITLGNGVESIGDQALDNCYQLVEVRLPASLKSIGTEVFRACDALRSITVEEGNTAFRSPDGVLFDAEQKRLIRFPPLHPTTHYTIPPGVEVIAQGAFFHCLQVQTLSMPAGLRIIEASGFGSCERLVNITLPDSVESLGTAAFSGCIRATNIYIGPRVKELPDRLFWNCRSVGAVTLPDTATSIGTNAFTLCSALKSCIFPKSLTRIGSQAFSSCSMLSEVELPASLTELALDAFARCTSIKQITVAGENPLFSSQDGILYDKTLTRLLLFPPLSSEYTRTIPESVRSIQDGALSTATFLRSITFGPHVTNVLESGLWFLSELQAVHIPPNHPSLSSVDGVVFDKNKQTLLLFPTARVESFVVPEGVRFLGENTFLPAGPSMSLMFPSTLTLPSTLVEIRARQLPGLGRFRFVIFTGNKPLLPEPWEASGQAARLFYSPGTTGWESGIPGFSVEPWTARFVGVSTTGQGADAQLVLRVQGPALVPVVLERANDPAAQEWTSVTSRVLDESGQREYQVPMTPGVPAQFYRLRPE